MKKAATYVVTGLLILSLTFYWNFSVFLVHPTAAAPQGATLIVPDTDRLAFIDSADAICAREGGAVTAECRAATSASAYDPKQVWAELPYLDWLFGLSTGGAPYTE